MIITDNLGKSQKPSTSEQGLQTIPMNKNQHPDYPENSFMYEVHHLTDYTTWQNHSLKPPYQNRGKQNSGHTKRGWGKQQIVNTPTNTLLRQTTKPARLTLELQEKAPTLERQLSTETLAEINAALENYTRVLEAITLVWANPWCKWTSKDWWKGWKTKDWTKVLFLGR